MVSVLLFYPEIIRFNDMYYLHLKIENKESDKEICFRLIKDAQFKKIVALSNLIQRIYHNDIRNMLP